MKQLVLFFLKIIVKNIVRKLKRSIPVSQNLKLRNLGLAGLAGIATAIFIMFIAVLVGPEDYVLLYTTKALVYGLMLVLTSGTVGVIGGHFAHLFIHSWGVNKLATYIFVGGIAVTVCSTLEWIGLPDEPAGFFVQWVIGIPTFSLVNTLIIMIALFLTFEEKSKRAR